MHTEKIFINNNIINDEKKLNIIHFNDVYNIENGNEEPVGGAARFLTAIERLIQQEPSIVLFSGDAISPSNSKNKTIN
jgi:5'-nucleotidase